MTLLTADFEAGTNGATIATTDTGSATPLQLVTLGGGATVAYDTAQKAHGTKSAKFATGATLANAMLKWTTALTGTTIATGYARAYLYLTTFATQIVPLAFMNGQFSNRVGVRITNAGNLAVLVNGVTVDQTGLATLPLNAWFRLELKAVCDATAGAYDLRYSSSPDSSAVDEELVRTAINTGGVADSVAFGVTQQITNAPAFWMDDLAAQNSGFVGPVTMAGSGAPVSAGFFTA